MELLRQSHDVGNRQVGADARRERAHKARQLPGRRSEHLPDDALHHQALRLSTAEVAARNVVAFTGEGERLRTIQALVASVERHAAVTRIEAFGNINPNAAEFVDHAFQAIEVHLAIMRDGHARKRRNRINRARRAAERIRRVDLLHSLVLDGHHSVARDRNEVDLAFVGVDAREHGHVASTGGFAIVARVAAQNEHVERSAFLGGRFARRCRLQRFFELGFFLLIVEAHRRVERTYVRGKRNATAHDECEQHREHDKRDAAAFVPLFAHAAHAVVLGGVAVGAGIEVGAEIVNRARVEALVEPVHARHAMLVSRARGPIGALAFFLLPLGVVLLLLLRKRRGALGTVASILRITLARLLSDKRPDRIGDQAAQVLRLGVQAFPQRQRRTVIVGIIRHTQFLS